MGVSTDGQICYGVVFEEGYQFPWDDERYDDSEYDWWREEQGYKRPFELYTSEGEYIDGIEPSVEKSDKYYNNLRDWDKVNPLPFETVNYCSGDYAMYILATRSSIIRNSRGSATEINPVDLTHNEEEVKAILDICKKYNLEFESGPAWYLTSYWC